MFMPFPQVIHPLLSFLKRKQQEKHRNNFAPGKQGCPGDFLKIFHASLAIPGGSSASSQKSCSSLWCEAMSMTQPYHGYPGKCLDMTLARTKDFVFLTSLPVIPISSLYFALFSLFLRHGSRPELGRAPHYKRTATIWKSPVWDLDLGSSK